MSQYVLTMQRFQAIQTQYQDQTRSILETQIRLKNPNATEEQIQSHLEGGQTEQLQIASSLNDLANESYNCVSARHRELLELEKKLRFLNQLFIDMESLVLSQGEVIDRVAFRVNQSKADVREARDDFIIARQITRKTFCQIQ